MSNIDEEIVEIGSVVTHSDDNPLEYEFRNQQFKFKLHPEVAKPNTYSFFLNEHVNLSSNSHVLDVGTGTGFLAIVISKIHNPKLVIATDINDHAIALAKENVELNNLRHKIKVVKGDLYAPVQGQLFDLIISQPRQTPTPPVGVEKRREDNSQQSFYFNTSGGETGLEMIEPLVRQSTYHLKKGGRLQIVVVDYLGTEKILSLMRSSGLSAEISGKLKTWLSPMTRLHLDYIRHNLKHTFPEINGQPYMHLLVLTATKPL